MSAKKEVMIDDQEIGIDRVASRPQHMALRIGGALLAQAVVGGGGRKPPGRRMFGDLRHFRDVPFDGVVRPGFYQAQIAVQRRVEMAAARGVPLQSFPTQVIGAPLEERAPCSGADRFSGQGRSRKKS